MEISAAGMQSFYRAAHVGLRRLEAQRPTGRRFGADADAAGPPCAATSSPSTASTSSCATSTPNRARVVFHLQDVAEDDAFGPRWATHAEGVDGESLGLPTENICDTLTESRRRLGHQGDGHSLLAVARRELDRVLNRRCQTSDWTRRPLSDDQLAYAAMDVEVLIDLYLLTHAAPST